MKTLGTLNGYEIKLCARKTTPKLKENNSYVDFSEKVIYVGEEACGLERAVSLINGFMEAYAERWGIYYFWKGTQKDVICQFFGSFVCDICSHDRDNFTHILEKLSESTEGCTFPLVIGEISDYTIKISTEGLIDSPEKNNIDFLNCHGQTSYDYRVIYILNGLGVEEKRNTLCHELSHAYMERWGIDAGLKSNAIELHAQFCGSVLKDLLIDNSEIFQKIITNLTE